MEPELRDGDWLLVDAAAYATRPPVPGALVVTPDPRWPARLLVKRVARVLPDASLWLAGDRADASTDSRRFGPVPSSHIVGRPWLRYWPLRRAGRVR